MQGVALAAAKREVLAGANAPRLNAPTHLGAAAAARYFLIMIAHCPWDLRTETSLAEPRLGTRCTTSAVQATADSQPPRLRTLQYAIAADKRFRLCAEVRDRGVRRSR